MASWPTYVHMKLTFVDCARFCQIDARTTRSGLCQLDIFGCVDPEPSTSVHEGREDGLDVTERCEAGSGGAVESEYRSWRPTVSLTVPHDTTAVGIQTLSDVYKCSSLGYNLPSFSLYP